jgi:C4-type Zn-finger protein
MNIPIKVLQKVIELAQDTPGVDYCPREGVKCPACGSHLKTDKGIYRTRPWEGSCRERYHKCPVCGLRFKSIESLKS